MVSSGLSEPKYWELVRRFMSWNIVAQIGGLVALALSFYNFILSRLDKKPRLRIRLEKEYVISPGASEAHPRPSLTIRARNPTDKTIKIEALYFSDGRRGHFVLPEDWGMIEEIPSHESRTLQISIIKFNEWAKVVNIAKPERGKFVLMDALENKYETSILGQSLSLVPLG